MAGTDKSTSLLPMVHSLPTAISKPAFPMRIGSYVIDDVVLGRGHYAIVRLATHEPTMEKVAMKCFEKTKLDVSDTLKMRRETSVVNKLRHPHIIHTYQILENHTFVFIAMEYAAGGEMFDQISSNGPYNETEARALFRQLVSAVRYCHNRNIVHRDLKTENVLLTSDKNVKLADFGFCDVSIPGESLEECCGSLPYAPPEIFYGKLYDGFKSDVWSLGVVLYVMLCGTLPFNEDNPDDTRQAIFSGIFEMPNHFSTEAKDLIRQILDIDYTSRVSLSGVIRHPWLNDDLGEPSSSDPLSDETEDTDRLDGELNEYVLDEMEKMGYSRYVVRMEVTSEQHSDVSATYDILDDRFHRHFAKRISSPITLSIPSSTDSPRRSSIVTGTVVPGDAEKLRLPVLTLSTPQHTLEHSTGRRGSLPVPLSFPAAFAMLDINRQNSSRDQILPRIVVPDECEDDHSDRFLVGQDTGASRRISDISMDLGSLADDDSDEEPDLGCVQRYLTTRGRSTRGTVGHYAVRRTSNSVTSAYEHWLSPTSRRHSDTPSSSIAQRMSLERMYYRGLSSSPMGETSRRQRGVDSGLGSPYLRSPSPMNTSPQPRFRSMNTSRTSLDTGHCGTSLTVPRTSPGHGRSSPGLSFLDKIYYNNPKQ